MEVDSLKKNIDAVAFIEKYHPSFLLRAVQNARKMLRHPVSITDFDIKYYFLDTVIPLVDYLMVQQSNAATYKKMADDLRDENRKLKERCAQLELLFKSGEEQ